MSIRDHGTHTKYVVDKCRCADCTDAARTYEATRRRQRAYGIPAYVDASPARAHVRTLSAQGMGWKRVARAAGLSASTVWKLMYGNPTIGRAPNKRIRPATAEAILSVKVDLADGAIIDSTGSTRRIQALVAIGWSQSKLAHRLGINRANFTPLAQGRRRTTVATARAVAALYDELSMTPPEAITYRDRVSVTRARNYAAAAGWAPPLAWDDDQIDNPDATSHPTEATDVADEVIDEAAVLRAIDGDRTVTLTPADRAEVIRVLHGRGLTDRQIKDLTGIRDPTTERNRLGLPVNRAGINWAEYGEKPRRREKAA